MLYRRFQGRPLVEMKDIPCTNILLGLDPQTYPNVILYGAEGAGKRMLLHAFMRHLFGRSPEYMLYTIDVEIGGTKREVEVLECEDAIEVRVGESGRGDKKVVQKIAQEMSQSRSISDLLSERKRRAKLLIIPDGESLSHGAQMALRRIMEQGAGNFRIAILTTCLGSFIEPFRSRFLLCRVPAMSDAGIHEALKDAAEREEKPIEENKIKEILKRSKGNIQKAFSLLEISMHLGSALTALEWEDEIEEISRKIITSPSIREILPIRERIYALLDKNIPGHILLSMIVENILKKEKSVEKVRKILRYASVFNMRIKTGSKDLFHIEAFIAQTMSIYTEITV